MLGWFREGRMLGLRIGFVVTHSVVLVMVEIFRRVIEH